MNTEQIISMVMGIGLIGFFTAIYMLPTIIAAKKKAPSFWVIFFINLMFGYTFIAWCVALGMAFSKEINHVVDKMNT